MHITASVFINDDEYGLHQDYEKWLEGLAPHAPTRQYRHNDTGEDNADAHMKRQIMGREVVVAVTNGRLDGSTEGFDRAQPRASPKSLARGSGSCVSWRADTGVSMAAAVRRRVVTSEQCIVAACSNTDVWAQHMNWSLGRVTAPATSSYGMPGRERQRKRETWLLLWQIIQHLL